MRIGINGFGQVGKALARRLACGEAHGIQIQAINETHQSMAEAAAEIERQTGADHETRLRFVGDRLVVGQDEVEWLSIHEPAELPWAELRVDVVIEAARLFDLSELKSQSDGKRTKVVMTGDLRNGLPDLTLVVGVNDDQYRREHSILCAGSDRTQSLVPLLSVLHEAFHIKTFKMCIRRPPYGEHSGRIRERTHDPEQLAEVLPRLKGKGTGMRVEDPNCRMTTVWLSVETEEQVTLSAVSRQLQDAAASRFSGVLSLAESRVEIAGNTHSCLIGESRIRARNNSIWLEVRYDPIASYVERLVEMLRFLEQRSC